MLQNITLDRPLAIIDLETTGLDPQKDRIVEICVLKVRPDGREVQYARRLDPGVPIPPEASAIHGIRDADVAGAPRFADVADDLLALLGGCHLCGFNLQRFDLRMLYAEFARVGRTLPLDGRAVIDAMTLYHRCEPRDLAAAVRFYLGREHEEEHSAAADARATAAVLDAMLARYPDLPRTVVGLHQHISGEDAVDSEGRFVRVEGQVRFAFGKYRGQPLAFVAANAPDYLNWLLGQDFFDDAKRIVREALAEARGSQSTVRRPARSSA
jgi:DNA polymerase-3 subunit epsilon